jgi:hypothetical protein
VKAGALACLAGVRGAPGDWPRRWPVGLWRPLRPDSSPRRDAFHFPALRSFGGDCYGGGKREKGEKAKRGEGGGRWLVWLGFGLRLGIGGGDGLWASGGHCGPTVLQGGMRFTFPPYDYCPTTFWGRLLWRGKREKGEKAKRGEGGGGQDRPGQKLRRWRRNEASLPGLAGAGVGLLNNAFS